MKKIIPIVAFLITSLSFAQIDKTSDTLEIWTVFSTGNFVNKNAERIVEKKWPFKIKGIAGDTFSKDLIDSLEVHNNEIWSFLASNGYTNPKERFESDLLREIRQINKAVKISNSANKVSGLYKKLKKKNLQNYTELLKKDPYKYVFKVYSFDVDKLDKDQTLELKYMVNLEKEKIKIIK